MMGAELLFCTRVIRSLPAINRDTRRLPDMDIRADALRAPRAALEESAREAAKIGATGALEALLDVAASRFPGDFSEELARVALRAATSSEQWETVSLLADFLADTAPARDIPPGRGKTLGDIARRLRKSSLASPAKVGGAESLVDVRIPGTGGICHSISVLEAEGELENLADPDKKVSSSGTVGVAVTASAEDFDAFGDLLGEYRLSSSGTLSGVLSALSVALRAAARRAGVCVADVEICDLTAAGPAAMTARIQPTWRAESACPP